MRHQIAGRKLGRNSSHRKALMRTMVTEFLNEERIVTTIAKAKELRSVAEKMITLGKKESLPARRRALGFIRSKEVVHKLFDSLGPRFADRNGGYTRIIRLGVRKGDNAELALLELVEAEAVASSAKDESGGKAKKGKKAAGKKGTASSASKKKDTAKDTAKAASTGARKKAAPKSPKKATKTKKKEPGADEEESS